MGRPRDGDDRVAWLLDHGHFTAALDVLEADRGLRRETHQQARPLCGLAHAWKKRVSCFHTCEHTKWAAIVPSLEWVDEVHI